MRRLGPKTTHMKLLSLFKKDRAPKLTGRTIDMTYGRRGWGHNFSMMMEKNAKSAKFAIWVTPGPKVGDQMEYEVKQGLVTVLITDVEWTRNVDDMYWIHVKPLKLNGKDVQ